MLPLQALSYCWPLSCTPPPLLLLDHLVQLVCCRRAGPLGRVHDVVPLHGRMQYVAGPLIITLSIFAPSIHWQRTHVLDESRQVLWATGYGNGHANRDGDVAAKLEDLSKSAQRLIGTKPWVDAIRRDKCRLHAQVRGVHTSNFTG